MRLAVTAIVPRHRVGVGVVCIDEAGRILLLQHVFHHATTSGDYPEVGSPARSFDTGSRTRTAEETGLQVKIGMPVYVGRSPLSMGIEIVSGNSSCRQNQIEPRNSRLSLGGCSRVAQITTGI